MIEISFDGKTARERLFDTYDIIIGCKITPKNNEIRKYCEFLKFYGPKYSNILMMYFIMEIDSKEYKKVNYSIIEDNEKFIFEFPDDYPEEDLFYFKLKYC